MYRKVTIEPWKADETYVHVHEHGYDGIHSYRGSVVTGATVETVLRIGKLSGLMRFLYGSEPSLDGNCHGFCRMCEDVIDNLYNVAEVRGQMEDAGLNDYSDNPVRLDDLELAYLDWQAREQWMEEARDVRNPWTNAIRLQTDVFAAVAYYVEEHYSEGSVR